MPAFTFTSPDGKKYSVNGPDGATQEQAFQILQSQLKSGTAQPKSNYDQAADEMSGMQKFSAGIGGGLYGAYLGTKQAAAGIGNKVGLVSDNTMGGINSDVQDFKDAQGALNKTGSGLTGNIVGSAAALAPTAFIPGANTAVGATLVGGLTGAVTTPGDLKDRAIGAGFGAAGGALGQYVGGKIGNALASNSQNKLAQAAVQESQNASRDATLNAGKDLGLMAPPSQVNPSVVNKALEGFSGKITTAQALSSKNQNVVNDVARKAIGISEDTPITKDILNGVRQQAGQAYDALRGAGTITADQDFGKALQAVTKKYEGAAKDFPELAKNNIADITNSVNKPQFSADSAIDAISILRDKADAAFRQGDKAMGNAYRSVSGALEDVIDRNLQNAGPEAADLLTKYRDSRALIAKTYSIESALNDATGNVSAAKLASQLSKGKPLSGDVKTVAEFAQAFPKAAQNIDKIGSQPGVSPLDFAVAAMRPTSALGKMADVATLGARPVVRSLITSQPYQNALVNPSYGPGVMNALLPPAVNSQAGQNALRLLPQVAGATYSQKK